MNAFPRRGLHLAAARSALVAAALAAAHGAAADPAPPFRDLLIQARATAPRLAEAAATVRQTEGLARQAGARPNPSVGVVVENIGGSGPYGGWSAAETTVQVEQPLELGGKRAARIDAGRASVEAARRRLDQSRADFAFDLAGAYGEAEAADRRVNLSRDGLALAREDLRAARALVGAGKEAELRALQAEAAATAAQATLSVAEADRAGAYARLTALAGSSTPFTALGESLLTRASPASGDVDVDLAAIPSVAAAEAEREAAARRVRVERTRAVPDVTASLGVRRFNGDGSYALVGGISAPLPLFDRNRGNVSAALAELGAAEARLNAARLDAQAELMTARFQIGAAQSREAAARQGEDTAGEAYRLTRIAYESGKGSLIELNDARRALSDARTQTIDAQLVRLRAEAGLARLQGRAPFGAAP